MSNEEQMRADFESCEISMPASLTYGTDEYEAEFNWRLWKACASQYDGLMEDNQAFQREIDALNQQVLELSAQVETMREALNGVIEWDKRRQFVIPYKVRDPIHAAIKITTSSAILAHDNEVAAKALEYCLEEYRRFPHDGMIRIIEAFLNDLRSRK